MGIEPLIYRTLYSHTLLILTESSKSKNQVVHGQMFKDLPSSKCPVSEEKSMLDMKTLASGSIPTRGNISLLNLLFSHSKTSDTNIGIIANFV